MKGTQAVWFIGDEFTSRSFTEHFRHARTAEKKRLFTAEQFEIEDYASTKYSSSIREVLPHLTNLLGKAISEQKYLPSLIVFVVDDDVIKQIQFPKRIKQEDFDPIIKYLFKDTHRQVVSYHNALPTKAKSEFPPHIAWIVPPTHKYFQNNTLRDMFASGMERVLKELDYNNVCCLRLKKTLV